MFSGLKESWKLWGCSCYEDILSRLSSLLKLLLFLKVSSYFQDLCWKLHNIRKFIESLRYAFVTTERNHPTCPVVNRQIVSQFKNCKGIFFSGTSIIFNFILTCDWHNLLDEVVAHRLGKQHTLIDCWYMWRMQDIGQWTAKSDLFPEAILKFQYSTNIHP